jgi:hypothetical protein
MITHEDEARYGLKPLPDVPFCGPEEAQRRRKAYEDGRAARNPPFQRGTRPAE